MKFSLVFDNSGDQIDFETVYNDRLFEYFVQTANGKNHNTFSDNNVVGAEVDRLLTDIQFSLSKTNEILYKLYGKHFPEHDNRLDYLDQKFLNKQHETWVASQHHCVDIDQLRFSSDKDTARLGYQLHDLYPDHIRKIYLAEAMIKLGYIFPYEEVNLTIHRLENFFAHPIEFKSPAKWRVFENPFQKEMISNNDIVNFSFGYTYVGRQYFNKWQYFDTDLECKDHYNYETLEWAFQINLDRPQTIPYSKEFTEWCKQKNVPMISTQIPIGNIVDIEKNLKYYRTILYKNSRDSNQAKLIIT